MEEDECFMCEKQFDVSELNKIIFRSDGNILHEVLVCDNCIGEIPEEEIVYD